MNSKGIVAIPQEKVGHICFNCLTETDNLHKISIPAMGYGSSFDNLSTEVHLCDKCYQESNPEIWSMKEISEEYWEEYVHEKEMLEYIKNLPLQSREIVWNHFAHGAGADYNMESQDWIDFELGELSHEKCKEYGYYSPQEEQAYKERFPTCEYPVNITYEDGSHGCHCRVNTYTAFGEYGQTCDEYNISNECYECEYYKKRETAIEEIKSIDEDDYWLYICSKLKQDELKSKFERK